MAGVAIMIAHHITFDVVDQKVISSLQRDRKIRVSLDTENNQITGVLNENAFV